MTFTSDSQKRFMVAMLGNVVCVLDHAGRPVATIETMTIEVDGLADWLASGATGSCFVTARLKKLAQ